jgi:serine O-acetyltransferase
VKQSFKQTIFLIQSDMLARSRYEKKNLSPLQILKFLIHSASLCCVIYRFQIFFFSHHLSFIASLLKELNGIIFTVDIDSRTDIGPGFLTLHSNFIVIGPYVKIGSNCVLSHQNTITPSPFYFAEQASSKNGPRLANDVFIGGGTSVVGDVFIGDGVQIAMNSLVDRSFPDQVVLFGVPAKVVGKVKPIHHKDIF